MLISIIIPCHNSSVTINRAVDSVLSQTWKKWELILINNNSTDDTWEKLIEIQKNNPERAIIVLDEKEKGAPAARNKGLYAANGEWVQFLDADDELLPQKIEKQIEQIHTGIDVIYSPFVKIRENNEKNIYHNDIDLENIWRALFTSKIGITSSNLWKKETLIAIRGWNPGYSSSQDSNLSFDLLKKNAIFFPFNESLTIIHAAENSITRNTSKSKIKALIFNFIDLRVRIIGHLKMIGLYEDVYKELYNDFVANCYIWYFKDYPDYVFYKYNAVTNHKLTNRIKINYIFLLEIFKDPIYITKNLFK